MNQIPTKQDGWHLKKEVQITQIVTILTVALSAFWYISKLEQRIALIEQSVVVQRDRDAGQDRAMNESAALLRSALERIDGKLDRLIERPTK